MAKRLRRGSAKPLFGGSNPPVASKFFRGVYKKAGYGITGNLRPLLPSKYLSYTRFQFIFV